MKEEPENHILVSVDRVKKNENQKKKANCATLQNQKLDCSGISHTFNGLKRISSSSSVLRQQVDSQGRNTLRRQRKEYFRTPLYFVVFARHCKHSLTLAELC